MATFDAILVTDTPAYPSWNRGYGAHRLATHLRGHGYTVLVIDFSAALTLEVWEQIVNLAVGPNTQFVGFSTTWWRYRNMNAKTHSLNLAVNVRGAYGEEPSNIPTTLTHYAIVGQGHKIVDPVKKRNPKTKILLGGPKIDWYLDFPADHFIAGLAEVEIIDYMEQPKRIWNKLINHDTKAESRDWGWLDSCTTYTEYDQIKSDELLTLEVTRGCRFKCTFCQFPLIGKKDLASYLKTKETLYNELLENYTKWGITRYFIADDTFNDSTEKLYHVLDVVKRLPFKPKFRCYIRLDVIANNPEQAQLLLDIGMVSCFIGIESFKDRAARFAGKGMSVEKRKQALHQIKEVWKDEVYITAGYIVGLPWESYSELRETANWFLQPDCPIHTVYYYPLMIMPLGILPNVPRSELDKDYEKYGYTIPDITKLPAVWYKNDGTDIPDANRAIEITQELKAEMDKKEKPIAAKAIAYIQENSIKDPQKEYFPNLINMLSHNTEKKNYEQTSI
jgi:hypothetical protein